MIGELVMNIWHDIDCSRINEDDFIAVIEISKGSKMKYELDKDTGMLILDRVLSTSTIYPASYGFIPKTFCDDNDPLDVLVLCQEPIKSYTAVRCYPIGMLKMIDNNETDEKIIAIPFKDPSMNQYHDISELPKHLFEEIMHFFIIYKALENKETTVGELLGCNEAKKCIKEAKEFYNKKFL